MNNIVEKDDIDILRNANGSFQKPIHRCGRIHFRKTSVCYYLKNCGEALKFLHFLSLGRVATELKHSEEKAMESMNELIP